MRKHIVKFLLGAAAAGAAAFAVYKFLTRGENKENSWNEDMEDFEDGLDKDAEEDSEEKASVSREYVTIPVDHHENSADAAQTPEEDGTSDTGASKTAEENAAGNAAAETPSPDTATENTSVRDSVASGVEAAVNQAAQGQNEEN